MNWQVRLEQWASPRDAPPAQRRNFLNAQLEGVGISLANVATPFLPVYLARLGASNFEVGLLSALPAFAGLVLAIGLGRMLQRQKQIVPWYGWARFLSILAYGGMALATMLLPSRYAIIAILAIWAVSTVPQTIVSICFSVVMNAVAGPNRRYDLLSRRWSLMGLVTAIIMALASPFLAAILFPLNYQLLFIIISLGAFLTIYFTLKIRLPDAPALVEESAARAARLGLRARLAGLPASLRSEPAFVKFTAQRFIYLAGVSLAVPIFPLYYVRVAQASDASIGLIGTSQTITLLLGYWFWTRLSQRRGSRVVLLATSVGLALFPALTAATSHVGLLVALAGASGIFQAGLDLVFFDEMMKRVPEARAPMFIAFDTSVQNLSAVAAPLLGTLLADQVGLGGALLVSAGLRLVACFLFARDRSVKVAAEPAAA